MILSDMFATMVIGGLSEKMPRTWLYCWERDALEWLKTWRRRDPGSPINLWTAYYMQWGPPPWGDKKLTRRQEHDARRVHRS